ncbi:exo-alpha-sialidase [Streptomyces sp. NPDC004266]|uniref:exo-alpha-sialidase n=1 Tax=Streptomyces sp. NPDC004266 TaxID=3364693 RepID=UPI00368F0AB5
MSRKRRPFRSRLAGTAAALILGALLPAVAPSAAHAGPGELSATVSADCTSGRLQLTLSNKSGADQTFTVNGPDGSASYTRTVPTGGSSLLYWTRADGAPYTLTATTPGGFSKTESGSVGCGLGAGKPQMNKTTLFTTTTVFHGLNRKNADGTHSETDATVKSVRIPAMAVTNSGTIIAMTDARVNGTADLPADIQIGMRRSTDNGATWSQADIIHHEPTTAEGAGDVSLLVDRKTGHVYCFYTYAPPGISFWSAGSGLNTANDTKSLHARYIKSTDDGATWGAPVDLNPQVKNPAWQQLFTSSGHGIQASDGRLVQPIAYRDASGVSHAANIYSTDGGATWKAGGSAGANINESKAVERSNGTIVQNMRHDTEYRRYYATSTDGGATFGTASATSITDARCNADELSYLKPADRGATGAPLRTATTLYSGNPGTTRDNLTVWLSDNDSTTWQPVGGAVLAAGAAGYSTMAVLGDGSVGNLYEVGGTGGIYFSRFTTDWIRNA